jgi:hypothetical protein
LASFHQTVQNWASYGYFPKPSKSVLIVPARTAFADLHSKVTTGHHCLDSFISDQDAFETWIPEKPKHWSETVMELALVAKNFPQSAYSGLHKSLQQEWQFVQRIKKVVGEEFNDIKKAISQTFLPALFGHDYDDDDPCHSLVTCLPMKHAGLAIPDPIESSEPDYEASTLACSHLLAALKGIDDF